MKELKFTSEPRLGEGIFTVPEASIMLTIPQNIIRRWIKSYWEDVFIKNEHFKDSNYIWGESRNKAFNFYTFVEIIAVHSLRKIGVPFQKIKIAHDQLVGLLDTPYPFASSKLMSDGCAIFWDYNKSTLINLDRTLQLSLKKIIEPFCKKLDFNEETFLAQKYWPLGKERSIVIDPHHCFGQPTIVGTNITTSSIIRLINAGEDKECVVSMYDIKNRMMEDVLLYEHRYIA